MTFSILCDLDGDGSDAMACGAGEDCDDRDGGIFPGAPEYCDNTDNDCDGTRDNEDAVDALRWYADVDRDQFGDPMNSLLACAQPSGYTADYSDCDDLDGNVNPLAGEICDDVDNDCDGYIDNLQTCSDSA